MPWCSPSATPTGRISSMSSILSTSGRIPGSFAAAIRHGRISSTSGPPTSPSTAKCSACSTSTCKSSPDRCTIRAALLRPRGRCPGPRRKPGKEASAMIIDCHAHVFQHWADACGHASREIHRTYIQKVQTRTSACVCRERDGAEVTSSVLFTPGENAWSGLRDVNLRVGNYGRIDFTIDGEDYYSQYLPVGMQQLVAPPELM